MAKPKPRIIVCDRGFVLIGRVEQDPDEYLFLRLTDCGVIRQWGTTKGLGQLAIEGLQTGTVIDREPDGTRQAKTSILRDIPCVAEKWDTWPPVRK